MSANVSPEDELPGFSTFDPMAAKNRNLDHRMPGRGKRHHALFDEQGKVDYFHAGLFMQIFSSGSWCKRSTGQAGVLSRVHS
jgi:hypothetical protein